MTFGLLTAASMASCNCWMKSFLEPVGRVAHVQFWIAGQRIALIDHREVDAVGESPPGPKCGRGR